MEQTSRILSGAGPRNTPCGHSVHSAVIFISFHPLMKLIQEKNLRATSNAAS